MADPLDLTPFGFTTTETKMYRTLITFGPGTGYALAQAAGLARANAYGALDGLVAKGAARVEGPRPKRYRPETGAALLTRLGDRQSAALERLSDALDGVASPEAPSLVELESPRAAWQALGRDIARATQRVWLCAPADAYAALAPVLRRAAGAIDDVRLLSTADAKLDFAEVVAITNGHWPGTPVLAVIDDRSAIVARRNDDGLEGHWGAGAAFVAMASLAFERLQEQG
jgi:sugar-specific transcriptional regulator TrmB